MGRVSHERDKATLAEIAEHLRRCDNDFHPALSQRVDVYEYARKLASRAARFEAWGNGRLIGLVAMYCNDPRGEEAFITSVSVAGDYRGRGIAAGLLSSAIEAARGEGFRRVSLEVGKDNIAAIALYRQAGFSPGDEAKERVPMSLELQSSPEEGGRL